MAKQIGVLERQAVCAFKESVVCQRKSLCGDILHGPQCDPEKCTFWRYGTTNLYVCMRSSSHVHKCGGMGECNSMIQCPYGEGYVCPYTGITSSDHIVALWGNVQDQAAISACNKVHKRRKVNPREERAIIEQHVTECITVFLDRVDNTSQQRRIQRLYHAAINCVDNDIPSTLSSIVDTFVVRNKPLVEPCKLTPERNKWLVTTITDYIIRLQIPGLSSTAKKKIHTCAVTCLLHMQEGERDKFNIEMFPRVPWLIGALRPIDVGRISDWMRCSIQERMWGIMCACISKDNAHIDRYTFMQAYTQPIPL